MPLASERKQLEWQQLNEGGGGDEEVAWKAANERGVLLRAPAALDVRGVPSGDWVIRGVPNELVRLAFTRGLERMLLRGAGCCTTAFSSSVATCDRNTPDSRSRADSALSCMRFSNFLATCC